MIAVVVLVIVVMVMVMVMVFVCRHHVPGTRFNFDEANLLITVDADLSSVFNWNVKQLFVYVVAEYTSSTGVRCGDGDGDGLAQIGF